VRRPSGDVVVRILLGWQRRVCDRRRAAVERGAESAHRWGRGGRFDRGGPRRRGADGRRIEWKTCRFIRKLKTAGTTPLTIVPDQPSGEASSEERKRRAAPDPRLPRYAMSSHSALIRSDLHCRERSRRRPDAASAARRLSPSPSTMDKPGAVTWRTTRLPSALHTIISVCSHYIRPVFQRVAA
jgi:hypothetical protein